MLLKIDVSLVWSRCDNPAVPTHIELDADAAFIGAIKHLQERGVVLDRDPGIRIAYLDHFIHEDSDKFKWVWDNPDDDTWDITTFARLGVEESYIRFMGINYDIGHPYLMWEATEFGTDEMLDAYDRGDQVFEVKRVNE